MEGFADLLNAAVETTGADAEAAYNSQKRHTQPGFRSVLERSTAYLPSMQVRDIGGPDTLITVSESKSCIKPLFRVLCSGQGVVGKAISESKVLALEAACDEFLCNLKSYFPAAVIKPISYPEGILVNPVIFERLEDEFGTVICEVFAATSKEGKVEFTCVVKCKDGTGVEQKGQASGPEIKWVKLAAAKNLWGLVKNDDFPTYKTHFDDEFDEMTATSGPWETCQKDPYDTDTDEELKNLVKERDEEKKKVPSAGDGDTDDELDELVKFSQKNM